MKAGTGADSGALVIATELIASCARSTRAIGRFVLNFALRRLTVMVGVGV